MRIRQFQEFNGDWAVCGLLWLTLKSVSEVSLGVRKVWSCMLSLQKSVPTLVNETKVRVCLVVGLSFCPNSRLVMTRRSMIM